MNQASHPTGIGLPAKIGAALFALWGVLHLWVGYEGVHQYLASGAPGLWKMLTGGRNAPHEAFQHATDALTANVHAHLILNFCLDVGGYGVLGLFVAWMIWKQGSWLGYVIGLIVIGIGDLAFLFVQVVPGIIELNAGTIGGPVLWLLACSFSGGGITFAASAGRTV